MDKPNVELTDQQPPSSSQTVEADDRRGQGPDRRDNRVDRRTGMERRQMTAEQSGYSGPERRSGTERRTGLERRRGPGRRLADERPPPPPPPRCAEEGEMTPYQFEFIMAIETYKKVNKRLYPTWTEILEIVRQLGYRKIEPRTIRLTSVPEPPLQGQKP